MAKSLFVLGLLLAGLGVLVFIFREILAAVAAGILVLAGLGMSLTALRMLWHIWQTQKNRGNSGQDYRENVRIRGQQDDNL
jgi:phage-related minor tail protein